MITVTKSKGRKSKQVRAAYKGREISPILKYSIHSYCAPINVIYRHFLTSTLNPLLHQPKMAYAPLHNSNSHYIQTLIMSRHRYKRFGNSSRLPNYENSKLKREERKSRSEYNIGDKYRLA